MVKLKPLDITLSSMFAALTALGAYLIIPLPFSPVPLTLQTFFTYTSGAVLGKYRGALSQIIYIGLGCLGLPVFAGGKAGFGVLLGPTGGYLIGFVLGAFLIGFLVERTVHPRLQTVKQSDNSVLSTSKRQKLSIRYLKKNLGFLMIIFSMIIGTLAIYSLGVLQLSFWMGITLRQALLVGMLPFIFGDSLKIFVAAIVSTRVMKIFPMLRIKKEKK